MRHVLEHFKVLAMYLNAPPHFQDLFMSFVQAPSTNDLQIRGGPWEQASLILIYGLKDPSKGRKALSVCIQC
jgi:hypothetical protein